MFFRKLLVILVVCLTFLFSLTTPVWAGDAAKEAEIFSANCAACHIGGTNAVNPAKTLKKSDLEQYGMYALEAIKTQVTNGKLAMPSFATRLSAQDIDDVATYVLAQADKGW
jgi:cytochrome c6